MASPFSLSKPVNALRKVFSYTFAIRVALAEFKLSASMTFSCRSVEPDCGFSWIG
jgi:hypothetical protein